MRGRTTRGFYGLAPSRSNKRMHATRDTSDVINFHLVGGRVMRSVMRRYDERGAMLRGARVAGDVLRRGRADE